MAPDEVVVAPVDVVAGASVVITTVTAEVSPGVGVCVMIEVMRWVEAGIDEAETVVVVSTGVGVTVVVLTEGVVEEDEEEDEGTIEEVVTTLEDGVVETTVELEAMALVCLVTEDQSLIAKQRTRNKGR